MKGKPRAVDYILKGRGFQPLRSARQIENMPTRILFFTQTGCLTCEVVKMFLEARQISFEERDIIRDPAARAELLETYHSRTAPTVVILTPAGAEVIEGFHPDRLDHFLSAA